MFAPLSRRKPAGAANPNRPSGPEHDVHQSDPPIDAAWEQHDFEGVVQGEAQQKKGGNQRADEFKGLHDGANAARKGRKRFFFEKKNQKTLRCAARRGEDAKAPTF
jgi:hypothetical protein